MLWLDSKRRAIAWAIALVLLTIVTRLPLVVKRQAIEDEEVYGVVAHEMLAGGQPYIDAVERKPPLLFWTYATIFKAFGPYNWRALHGVALVWILATMAALFVLGNRLFGPDAGLLAAFLYSVYQPWAVWSNLSFNGEVLMNLPIAWAYAIGFARTRSRLRPELPVAGVLLAAAFLLKQSAAIAALPLGLYLLHPAYRRARGYSTPDVVLQASWLTAGLVATLASVAFWLHVHGLLNDAVYWSIGDHDVPYIFWRKGLEHTALFVFTCLSLVAGALAGYKHAELWAGQLAERFALTGLAIVSAIGAAEPGRFFYHYYIALMPALAVMAAPALLRLWPNAVSPLERTTARLSQAWIVAALLLFFAIDYRELARLPAESEAGRYVREHSVATDRVFLWGRAPGVYLDSRRRPASRYIDTFPLTGFIFGPSPLPDVDTRDRILPGSWETLQHDFAAHPPAFIVDVEIGPTARNRVENFPLMANELANHYQLVARTRDGLVYRRL